MEILHGKRSSGERADACRLRRNGRKQDGVRVYPGYARGTHAKEPERQQILIRL